MLNRILNWWKHSREAASDSASQFPAPMAQPVISQLRVGRLSIPHRSIAIADPQDVGSPSVISECLSNEAEVVVDVVTYPSGGRRVASVSLEFKNDVISSEEQSLGTVGVDSAKVVLADSVDLQRHWTEEGPDRIGIISTTDDGELLRFLTKRFRLRTRQVNPIRSEVVGPVSREIEAAIEAYLASDPRYSKYPFVHFRLQTNNSFEGVNYLKSEFAFLPIGNDSAPVMFACATGYGDGTYEIQCQRTDSRVGRVKMSFMDD